MIASSHCSSLRRGRSGRRFGPALYVQYWLLLPCCEINRYTQLRLGSNGRAAHSGLGFEDCRFVFAFVLSVGRSVGRAQNRIARRIYDTVSSCLAPCLLTSGWAIRTRLGSSLHPRPYGIVVSVKRYAALLTTRYAASLRAYDAMRCDAIGTRRTARDRVFVLSGKSKKQKSENKVFGV